MAFEALDFNIVNNFNSSPYQQTKQKYLEHVKNTPIESIQPIEDRTVALDVTGEIWRRAATAHDGKMAEDLVHKCHKILEIHKVCDQDYINSF